MLLLILGALLGGCSRRDENKFEIKADPSTKPIEKKIDFFEKCFPDANRYHFEIHKEGLDHFCSRLLFNKYDAGHYPFGPLPWKREEASQTFQWNTQIQGVPFIPPKGWKTSKPMLGPYRPHNFALEATLYHGCSFDLYFSAKPDEISEDPVTFFQFYSPRKDGETCLPESDYSNASSELGIRGPGCVRFPPHDPSASEVVSSPMKGGSTCSMRLPFRMKLVKE